MKSKLQITLLLAFCVLMLISLASGFPMQALAQQTGSSGSFNIVQCGNEDTLNSPAGTEPESACTLRDLFDTGIRVINLLMIAAGVFATIRIVIAGGQMILSAGNQEMLTAGKNGLTRAVIGLVIVIISFLLINTLVRLLVPGGEDILRNPIEFILRS